MHQCTARLVTSRAELRRIVLHPAQAGFSLGVLLQVRRHSLRREKDAHLNLHKVQAGFVFG